MTGRAEAYLSRWDFLKEREDLSGMEKFIEVYRINNSFQAEKDRIRTSIKAAEDFFEAAREKCRVVLLSHSGPHGFDSLSRTDETVRIINETLDFIGLAADSQNTRHR